MRDRNIPCSTVADSIAGVALRLLRNEHDLLSTSTPPIYPRSLASKTVLNYKPLVTPSLIHASQCPNIPTQQMSYSAQMNAS